MKDDKSRKIIHIDMDAFFAAIAIRDNPELRGKAVIIGAPPGTRGVVATCNYEARKYGIHSAMPTTTAHRLCPHAIFVKSDWAAIKEASQIIRSVFYEYSDLVEPLSSDEAYIDVTVNKKNIRYATQIASEMKKEIFKRTQLIASAGVSYNKFLAKIGSDYDKPDGLKVIIPSQASMILDTLPIRKFHGIGRVTEAKMLKLGIKNGRDLKNFPLRILSEKFGKAGLFYYWIVRGVDDRKVIISHERKSIGSESTFATDKSNTEDLLKFLKYDSGKMEERLTKAKSLGKTITLKIKYDNFDQITRSQTLPQLTKSGELIFETVKKLLINNRDIERKVRLLGISITNLKLESEIIWEQLKIDCKTDF